MKRIMLWLVLAAFCSAMVVSPAEAAVKGKKQQQTKHAAKHGKHKKKHKKHKKKAGKKASKQAVKKTGKDASKRKQV